MSPRECLEHVSGKALPGRHPDLPRDEVETGDELRDPMLDLEPRVHLEEVVVAVGVHEELDGRGIMELDRAGHPAGTFEQRGARLVPDAGRWRLLHELLVTSLDRAIPLAQHGESALSVAEQLNLDVPGRTDQPLHVHRPVAERGFGLAPRRGHGIGQVVQMLDSSHSPASAARSGFEHHREAEIHDVGDVVLERDGRARHDGDPGGSDRSSGGELVAQRLDRVRGRADEDEAGRLHRSSKVGVLREESVSRVDRIGAGTEGRIDHGRHRQVRRRRCSWTDVLRPIGQPHMKCPNVGIRVHGDG